MLPSRTLLVIFKVELCIHVNANPLRNLTAPPTTAPCLRYSALAIITSFWMCTILSVFCKYAHLCDFFLMLHIRDIIRHIVCLSSICITISGSIHEAASGIFSLFLMAEKHSLVYMSPMFLVHLCVDGHYGCFYVVAILSRAAVNFEVPVFFSIRPLSIAKPLYMKLIRGL